MKAAIDKIWATFITPITAVSMRQNSTMKRPSEYRIKYMANTCPLIFNFFDR